MDTVLALEEGATLTPRFDANGLVTVVATDVHTGDVLMVAHMNAEALALTLKTGEAHYWSRSRQAIWHKGATSGHTQRVLEMRMDCDQDAVWIKVEPHGPGQCHVGYQSCFYRVVGANAMLTTDKNKTYNPQTTYHKDVKTF